VALIGAGYHLALRDVIGAFAAFAKNDHQTTIVFLRLLRPARGEPDLAKAQEPGRAPRHERCKHRAEAWPVEDRGEGSATGYRVRIMVGIGHRSSPTSERDRAAI
jgi:hypothetical protein